MEPAQVAIIRVYEDPGRARGEYRVLVDRLWPRGLTKERVDFDEWAKEIAPSTELRRWFGHDPERFAEFSRRYRAELARAPADGELSCLRVVSTKQRLVLLTATRDVAHSAAAVLKTVLCSSRR